MELFINSLVVFILIIQVIHKKLRDKELDNRRLEELAFTNPAYREKIEKDRRKSIEKNAWYRINHPIKSKIKRFLKKFL